MLTEVGPQQLNSILESGDRFVIFFYTPLCGTCQLARRMLNIATEALPNSQVTVCNVNLIPEQARGWEIESVPCLAVIEQNVVTKKVYAFHSVDTVYDVLKSARPTD